MRPEELAQALRDALEADDPEAFIGEFDARHPVTIDGKFNLTAIATVLISRMNTPTTNPPLFYKDPYAGDGL